MALTFLPPWFCVASQDDRNSQCTNNQPYSQTKILKNWNLTLQMYKNTAQNFYSILSTENFFLTKVIINILQKYNITKSCQVHTYVVYHRYIRGLEKNTQETKKKRTHNNFMCHHRWHLLISSCPWSE